MGKFINTTHDERKYYDQLFELNMIVYVISQSHTVRFRRRHNIIPLFQMKG